MAGKRQTQMAKRKTNRRVSKRTRKANFDDEYNYLRRVHTISYGVPDLVDYHLKIDKHSDQKCTSGIRRGYL